MSAHSSEPVSRQRPDRLRSTATIRLRAVGLVIGLGLLVAAVIVIWRRQDIVAEALAVISRPAPGYLLLLLAGVAANVVLTGLMFSLLMSRYGRVGVMEMQALIAAAALVNYLPLRPGLVGRIAYHQAVNRILAIHSAKTILQASALSLAIVAYLAAAVLLSTTFGASHLLMACCLFIPVPLLLAGAAVRHLRVWLLAALLRYAEVFVWGLRYYAAFKLIGVPVAPHEGLVFACISMIATMVPFVSNGLGLREWAVGLGSPLLKVGRVEHGITAELVNRAAEMAVIVALGLIGLAYLAARRRAPAQDGQGRG
ncbi:MAG: hypothetical protein JSV91_13350 [Phycisphaerales bacterium]|nr:MAG: hypothetical protein JSV91_13350 [Phycisphaerales bacterium]